MIHRAPVVSFAVALALLATIPCHISAADYEVPDPATPQVAGPSDEGEKAIGTFRVPEGFSISLFAAEPLLANPVAFWIDARGRVYVCETFRQNRGVTDNRRHGKKWLEADLAAQSVEDRRRYHLKQLGKKAAGYMMHDDRIRLLTDSDGDGRADKATVFADGFNDLVDGTGAGVLSRDGRVYYTCIPSLYLLQDEDSDGRSDVRKVLHTGYGVRVAFRGHDMHGLTLGPDGRLYFSIGDRGYNVQTEGRRLKDPESGAVFRCDLDGSNLEVFATGLRNPQELAFDDHGNLFTGDNNSDSGDRARFVYLVRGGDSGWRMAYQYLRDRGPFNREKLWHPQHQGQPAYISPPISNISSGPSGLTYYPGTGFGEKYRGHFFLCDFRGGAGNSGVLTFKTKPKGAGFELVDSSQFLWNILATDVDFGPDGAMFVSDWVHGWNGTGKGRIYRLQHHKAGQSDIVAEVKRLLAEGFSQRSEKELAGLLAHADRRVRLEAQLALVEKEALEPLRTTAKQHQNLLARLHGVWGLGILARQEKSQPAIDTLRELLQGDHAEVRAQAAKVLGDANVAAAEAKLIDRLADENLRVRYFAAQALGRVGSRRAVEPLLAMLAENANQDVYLRHAGVMGLAGSGDVQTLVAQSPHPSTAARLGILLALRRLQSPQVARFLQDTDRSLIVEAARAIHDVPIPKALPPLAALADRPMDSDALIRRVINANYRLGTAEHAAALARLAGRSDIPEDRRVDALKLLSQWQEPSSRDWVLGMWRPLDKRDANVAKQALTLALPAVLTGPDRVRREAAAVAAKLGIREVGPVLVELLQDTAKPGTVRGEALDALLALGYGELQPLTRAALTDPDGHVRAAARRVLAKTKPAAALPLLEKAVYEGTLVERQDALAALGKLTQPGTDAALSRILDRLIDGKIPLDTRLDVLAAAEQRSSAEIRQKVKDYQAAKDAGNPLAKYHEALAGGSAARGEQLFFGRSQLSCVRCHQVGDRGGDVGPNLTKIGTEKKPDYLLESIVLPNKTIAKGFETQLIITLDGRVLSGILKGETKTHLQLVDAEGKRFTVEKALIEEQRRGKSAMPEDLIKHLSPAELRDLVAYLGSLKK